MSLSDESSLHNLMTQSNPSEPQLTLRYSIASDVWVIHGDFNEKIRDRDNHGQCLSFSPIILNSWDGKICRASQAAAWKEQAQLADTNTIGCFTCDESHNLYQLEGALYRFDFAMQGNFSIV